MNEETKERDRLFLRKVEGSWFSQEEFARLQQLSKNMFEGAGSPHDPAPKKCWVEFDANAPETHPEAYRTCQIVSDDANWEKEELAYWDGHEWFGKDFGYSLKSVSDHDNLSWHYVTFPERP